MNDITDPTMLSFAAIPISQNMCSAKRLILFNIYIYIYIYKGTNDENKPGPSTIFNTSIKTKIKHLQPFLKYFYLVIY
jgi:hypothetical protein